MRTVLLIASLAILGAATSVAQDSPAYDPLKVDDYTPPTKDLVVKDAKRSREIPIRVYLPRATTPGPVVLFSHGLGGSCRNNPYLGNHWARRGYVVVFVQHPGSDEAVWKDAPLLQRMTALKKAASLENFQARVQDVPTVFDQLEAWNQADDSPLKGRMDLKHIGMSGHSFGAVTTQAVSGQRFLLNRSFTDPRILAAVAMSPSSPRLGNVSQAFGSVKLPWLLMTGTNDTSPIDETTVASRRAVYTAVPAGNKYEVVLDQAEHSAFGDRALPGEREKRNPNHHKVILAVTTAFWDAYLREDTAARKWLDGDGPRGVMEKADIWQKK